MVIYILDCAKVNRSDFDFSFNFRLLMQHKVSLYESHSPSCQDRGYSVMYIRTINLLN